MCRKGEVSERVSYATTPVEPEQTDSAKSTAKQASIIAEDMHMNRRCSKILYPVSFHQNHRVPWVCHAKYFIVRAERQEKRMTEKSLRHGPEVARRRSSVKLNDACT